MYAFKIKLCNNNKIYSILFNKPIMYICAFRDNFATHKKTTLLFPLTTSVRNTKWLCAKG